MIQYLQNINPVFAALLGTLFTYAMTACGASMVFFFKKINKKVLNFMLAFAAGVMIAASFWSLLAPAIAMAEKSSSKLPAFVPAVAGFLSGGLFLFLIDKLLPHIHPGMKNQEGIKSSFQRSTLLVLAITLHNIPEGLAVGVAFGAVAAGLPEASIAGAVALAIGIGIQNFPEGAAVSVPLRREGMGRGKSFFYGQASGIVEPIAGVIGAFAAIKMQNILPFALSFAAGAMIYVVVEELIPESQSGDHSDLSTWGAMIGFAVMMVLDVALG